MRASRSRTMLEGLPKSNWARTFFLSPSEIVIIDSYSIDKTLLHNSLNLRTKIGKRIKFHKLVNHKLVKFKYCINNGITSRQSKQYEHGQYCQH